MTRAIEYTTLRAVLVAALVGGGCTSDESVTAPTAVSAATAPVGTTWVVIEVDGIAASGTRPLDLIFESERRIGGSSGCNRYFAELNPSPPSVRMGSVGGTLMACEPPLMEQEHRFLNALKLTTTYRVKGDTMQFNDRTGRPLIFFRRAAPYLNPMGRP